MASFETCSSLSSVIHSYKIFTPVQMEHFASEFFHGLISCPGNIKIIQYDVKFYILLYYCDRFHIDEAGR